MGLFLRYLIEFVCGEYFIVIKMLIQTSERMMWSIKRIFKSVYSNFHIMKSLTIYSIQKAATAGGGLSAAATERSMSCPAIRHFTASRLQNTIADYRKIIIATGT